MENILIIIEGGIVQQVLTNNRDVKIVVMDFDKHSTESVVADEHVPKVVKGKFHNAFKNSDKWNDKKAHKLLKKINY